MLTTAGSVLGAIVPGIVGAGPIETLVGTILAGLLSAFFTSEGPATRAKALAALAFTLVAVILTISGFTLADLIRGRSVLGDRQYTFPVPSSPVIEDYEIAAPTSSPPAPPLSPNPNPPMNPDPSPTRGLNAPPNPTLLPTATVRNPPPTTATPPTTAMPPNTTMPPNTLPTTTTSSPTSPSIFSDSDEEVLEEGPVELSAQPGQESVEIDWWRSVSDGSGDLQMNENGIFTVLGAQLGIVEDSPTPTRARCAGVQNWTTEISFAALHVGSQLCAQSRGSRYAMLQVRALPTSSASNGRFIFYGRTWALRFSP